MVPVILGAGTMANSTPFVGLGSPPGRLLAATRVKRQRRSGSADIQVVARDRVLLWAWVAQPHAGPSKKLHGMSKPCKTLK